MMRKGVTLVEVMLAVSMICLVSLGLFEAVILATRITHENSEFLAADALAWDIAWKRFNESYEDLSASVRGYSNPIVDTVDTSRGREESAAPVLWYGNDCPVKVYTVITNATYRIGSTQSEWVNGLNIHVNVEWGPSNNRRSLSSVRNKRTKNYNHDIGIFRGDNKRGE